MAKMTVGRLKSILVDFDDNDIVYIFGGEGIDGSFAYLNIAHNIDDILWEKGTTILEYAD